MSQRQKKASFSAQKGGLSVQELKQMTAKRMAEGGPRSQSSLQNTFPPPSFSQSRAVNSDAHGTSHTHDQHTPLHPGGPSGTHTSPSHPSNQRPVSQNSPAHTDKSLSVQELKALTRRRLAREFAGPAPIPNTNHTKPPTGSNRNTFNPSMTFPQMDPRPSPDKASMEDYRPSSLGPQQPDSQHYLSSLHGGLNTRSGSTSPTVDSSSTGSDGGEYMLQHQHPSHHNNRQTSPLLHPSTGVDSSRHYKQNSPYSSNGENLESLDPMLLPPRRGGGSVSRGREAEVYRESVSLLLASERDRGRDNHHDYDTRHSDRREREHLHTPNHPYHDHDYHDPHGQRDRREHDYREHDRRQLDRQDHERREHDRREYDRREHDRHEHERRERERREHDRREHDRREHERREHERRELDRREHDRREHDRREHDRRGPAAYPPSGMHAGLHAKLLNLEQQQLARDQRDRDRERDYLLLRQQQQRQQQQMQERGKYMNTSTSYLETNSNPESYPSHNGKNSQSAGPPQQLPPQYESSLRKMVMNKARTNNNYASSNNPSGINGGYDLPLTSSSSSSSYNYDSSLLPSGSPFYPSNSTVPPSVGAFPLPTENEPSPPPSPRSMRHGSRRPLSITCPAPVRIRSSSDSNDLAFAVAESVLLTPTAGRSPATTFRKGIASSPTGSRRNSIDSPRGSFSSNVGISGIGYSQSGNFSDCLSTTSASNGGGSVTSGGGGSSVLDVEHVMSNQFSLDSNDYNDEYSNSNSSHDVGAILTDL